MWSMRFSRRRRRAARTLDQRALIDCGYATATGTRRENQDRCAVSTSWAVVSDGVGGHAGGGLAADLTLTAAVSCLNSDTGTFDEAILNEAVRRANSAVRSRRQADDALAGMGATLTMAVATSVRAGESRWLVTHVGDSPAWVVGSGRAAQVTEDHTLAAELVRCGVISEEAATNHPGRHVVVRAIGMEDRITADTTTVVLKPGDALLIASDGLTGVLDSGDIHGIVAPASTAKDAARRLVDTAVERGADDNVTAALLRHRAHSNDG